MSIHPIKFQELRVRLPKGLPPRSRTQELLMKQRHYRLKLEWRPDLELPIWKALGRKQYPHYNKAGALDHAELVLELAGLERRMLDKRGSVTTKDGYFRASIERIDEPHPWRYAEVGRTEPRDLDAEFHAARREEATSRMMQRDLVRSLRRKL